MRVTLFAASLLATAAAPAQVASVTQTSPAAAPAAPAPADDPYIWLEDKDGPKALAWVEAENARTLPRLQQDPRYRGFYADALTIAQAQDRIPSPEARYGRIYNFWRDAQHPQGIWRWTTRDGYATPQPSWTTALDLDALSKAEGKKWVWKGASCLQPEERFCLVALSEGGEDAIAYREFDLKAGAFVPGGFSLPKSKQGATWIDRDTLMVSRDWGPGTMTASSYPFVVKSLKRGQPLTAAVEVYRGAATDQLGTYATAIHDGQGNRAVFIQRRQQFFGGDKLIWTQAGGARKLDMPARAVPQDMVDGQVVFETSDPWGAVPAGALAYVSLKDLEGGRATPKLLFAPTPRQAVSGVSGTKNTLVVLYTDNVRGRAAVYRPGPDGWTSRQLPLPDNVNFGIAGTSGEDDRGYLLTTGFLTPTTLASLDFAGTAAPVPVKALPPKFDATGLKVDQFEATSSDGTKIPYFVVHRPGADGGPSPTIMTAYGGFEIPMLPSYNATAGKLWLERGGAYVLANIRGGGEFGPAWHDAGRKTKRQIIYDDFAAVGRDLVARRVTDAQHLGIYGGSNGGLLMGVELTQHPELWKAVTIQVPLLDMVRYERIAAGASWVDEYGSVANPDEAAFLRRISPYANIRRGVAYPEPYIWTTTKDDRVGPQHARKFAARFKEYGLPYLFYEDTAGGHSGDADIEQGARLQALQMTYFAQKLMGPADQRSAAR